MRRRLYVLLGGSAGVAAVAVLVTEATEGQCSVICTWQIPVVLVGMAATLASMGAAVWLAVYELRRHAHRGSA